MAKAKTSTTSAGAKKDLQTLRTLERADLIQELNAARKNLFTLQMKHSLGELKQPHILKNERKYIAQISTLLSSIL